MTGAVFHMSLHALTWEFHLAAGVAKLTFNFSPGALQQMVAEATTRDRLLSACIGTWHGVGLALGTMVTMDKRVGAFEPTELAGVFTFGTVI